MHKMPQAVWRMNPSGVVTAGRAFGGGAIVENDFGEMVENRGDGAATVIVKKVDSAGSRETKRSKTQIVAEVGGTGIEIKHDYGSILTITSTTRTRAAVIPPI